MAADLNSFGSAMSPITISLPALCLAIACLPSRAETIVFASDFDAAPAAQIAAGSALLEGVQGFAGYGPAGNQFGGKFLRSATANLVTLTLLDLPAHSSISLGFLFAAIDSLDGTGSFPSGDFFKVTLDGTAIFRESFANALAGQIQSYLPPADVQLARRIDLGFTGPGGYYTDSAYNLAADPAFAQLAHHASTAVFTFQIEGVGVQQLADESWAMDNLRVSVNAVPEPASAMLLLAGLAMVVGSSRRNRRQR